jgi:hypothetical protein
MLILLFPHALLFFKILMLTVETRIRRSTG